MEFCWTTLQVSDMERSMAFYHGMLGLPVANRHEGGGKQIVMLGAADRPKIELLYDAENPKAGPGDGISIGFTVESLDAAAAHLKAGGHAGISPIVAPNPHVRFFFTKDPDGYTVQLVENG